MEDSFIGRREHFSATYAILLIQNIFNFPVVMFYVIILIKDELLIE